MRTIDDRTLSWCGVDVGGDKVRWCRVSRSAKGPIEVLEAPTLVSLGEDLCFVQAAQRLRAQSPEWGCHHLISLLDFATPSPHQALLEAREAVQRLAPAQSNLSAQELAPLTPLLSPRPGDAPRLMTARGERQPEAILSELLGELLSPPKLLGASEPASGESRALLWLTSPSESPYRRATLAHIFSELSAQHVVSVDRAGAIALGLQEEVKRSTPKPSHLWAILDVGASQASLSIVKLCHETRAAQICAQRGRSGIGAHLLERRLLQGRLSLTGLSWSGLSVLERAQRSIESQERVYWALRQAWPQHLIDAQYARLTTHELEVTQGYLEELSALCARWLSEMLIEQHLLLESLDGLWLTGAVGLALRRYMAREHPNLRVRFAPKDVAMRGLSSIVSTLGSEASYKVCSTLGDELWLTSGAHPPYRLLSSAERTPAWVDHLISPSDEITALWLRSSGAQQPTLWATHPPFSGEHRRLQLAYESPYTAHISWRSLSGAPVHASEGTWSLQFPHHPHVATPSSLHSGALT